MAERSDAELQRLTHGEFLAPGLIHEMRHPLMGIKAGLQLLEAQLGATLNGREEWQLITGQVARLEELFHSYQEFLHPEQQKPIEFETGDVLHRALTLVGYRLRKLGPRFSHTATRARAWGIPPALLHATINLLVNALDALEEAGTEGRIALRTLQRPDEVEIRVSDEGCGVSPESARRLFEPHFTTKAAAKGTGLGLAVSRHMITRFGGELALVSASDPDRLRWARTEFVIRLPRQKVAGADAAALTSAPVAAPPERKPLSLEGKIALVVDDEQVVQFVLKRALAALRMELLTAATAEAALELLERHRVDVLVTDKNLPGADGVRLATVVRERNPAAAVLMVTGYPSVESAEAALQAGVDDYLTKPFDVAEIAARIEDAVARRAASAVSGTIERCALVESVSADRAVLEAALTRIGIRPLPARSVEEALAANPQALLVAAAQLSAADRKLIRDWHRQQRLSAVLVVCEEGSLADAMMAIGIGATAQLARRLTGEALEGALRMHLKARRA